MEAAAAASSLDQSKRNATIDKLYKIFADPPKGVATELDALEPSRAEALARAIENAIYQISSNNDHEYFVKLRHIVFNGSHNPYLWTRLVKGDLKPERLVTMTSSELAKRDVMISRDNAHDQYVRESVIEGSDAGLRIVGEYACPHCSHRDARSSTYSFGNQLMLTCNNCGNTWKEGTGELER